MVVPWGIRLDSVKASLLYFGKALWPEFARAAEVVERSAKQEKCFVFNEKTLPIIADPFWVVESLLWGLRSNG